jgi:5-methyltetrahydropteroyltriglutamate--homocysteine methyltransferase
MKRSIGRILTTHTGSLPRPHALVVHTREKYSGQPSDPSELEREISDAVSGVVRKQAEAGITVINDGEQGKSNFWLYRSQRLTGFEMAESEEKIATVIESRDFPEFFARWEARGQDKPGEPKKEDLELCCTGKIEWKDFSEVERDIANLKKAAEGADHEELFMTAISPGCYLPPNHFYRNEEEYLSDLTNAMEREYTAIVKAGILLQIDSPDLTCHYRQKDITVEEHLKYIHNRVDAINHATRNLPADRIRVHVCWGADEGPHTRDIPLRAIVHELLRLRPLGLTMPGANGRHSHEWKVWEEVKLPGDKLLVPGVIDSTTNIVEHPEAVAERILRYAAVLGPERVIAGVDCGFDTSAEMGRVDPKIAWTKLRSLAEGAALASHQLWL